MTVKHWRRYWRHPVLFLAARGVLDPQWYVQHYPDVAGARFPPLKHFLAHGLSEGRDPSPRLSLSGYAWRYGRGRWGPRQALLHYWAWGRWHSAKGILRVMGYAAAPRGTRPVRLLVCAHTLGPCLFGAERSLLDVVRSLTELGHEVVVVLPNASHPDYLDALLSHCHAVQILPYRWWHARRPTSRGTVYAFIEILRQNDTEAVYLNTLTLDAPALAAKALGVKVITHVREMPASDPAMCKALGAHSEVPEVDAEVVVTRTTVNADLIIANSQFTGLAFLGRGTPVRVVPNMLEIRDWLTMQSKTSLHERPLRVGMLGSLAAKKGIADFLDVADMLAVRGVNVEFLLFGAMTAEVEHLLEQQAQRPGNVSYRGYVDDPRDALVELDVVVNLSHFDESFGRTVLEAMAAACAVVAYARGAVPELVKDGTTGFLVPFGHLSLVAQRITELSMYPARRIAMGQAGRARALARYDRAAFTQALGRTIEEVFPPG